MPPYEREHAPIKHLSDVSRSNATAIPTIRNAFLHGSLKISQEEPDRLARSKNRVRPSVSHVNLHQRRSSLRRQDIASSISNEASLCSWSLDVKYQTGTILRKWFEKWFPSACLTQFIGRPLVRNFHFRAWLRTPARPLSSSPPRPHPDTTQSHPQLSQLNPTFSSVVHQLFQTPTWTTPRRT